VKLVQIIAVAAAVFSATTAWSETVWQMPTPYSEANFHTQKILQFAKDVETATNSNLKVVVHPAGSLIKHAEIKTPFGLRRSKLASSSCQDLQTKARFSRSLPCPLSRHRIQLPSSSTMPPRRI
jgi:TRAP-type C4-dicarboxylate transport system substrate-binding protein